MNIQVDPNPFGDSVMVKLTKTEAIGIVKEYGFYEKTLREELKKVIPLSDVEEAKQIEKSKYISRLIDPS